MPLRVPQSYNQYRGHAIVSEPASEPVTKDEVKAHLRLATGSSAEDDELDLFIETARDLIEEITGLALIDQTWKMTLDQWPSYQEPWWDGVRQMSINELTENSRSSNILLPRYPLQSVDSITVDGSAINVADTFITDTQQRPGRLVIKSGATLPSVTEAANGIEIQYTAGYGASGSDVPGPLRLAIIRMVAMLYEQRGDGCCDDDLFNKSGARRLVNKYIARQL